MPSLRASLAWLGSSLVPRTLCSKTVATFFILWVAWFLFQVQRGGREAVDEVSLRVLEVSYNAHLFAAQQYQALILLWVTVESSGRLLAPFFVDVFIVLREVQSKLPIEAQLGAAGLALACYLVLYSRLVRQALFLPMAGVLWFALERFPMRFAYLALPSLGILVPVIGSLIAFRGLRSRESGFWLAYWFLFSSLLASPLNVPVEFSDVVYWKLSVIVTIWLVLWGGADIAFRYTLRIISAIWNWVSHRRLISSLLDVLFSWRYKIMDLRQSIRNNEMTNKWWIIQKLNSFASMGILALIAAGTVGLLGVLFVYKLLSVLSSAIVWPWFLYEIGSVVWKRNRQLYRSKLALALLFLLLDWVFKQSWFMLPRFLLDFIRIPTILVLNIVGELVLDQILVVDLSQYRPSLRASSWFAGSGSDDTLLPSDEVKALLRENSELKKERESEKTNEDKETKASESSPIVGGGREEAANGKKTETNETETETKNDTNGGGLHLRNGVRAATFEAGFSDEEEKARERNLSTEDANAATAAAATPVKERFVSTLEDAHVKED